MQSRKTATMVHLNMQELDMVLVSLANRLISLSDRQLTLEKLGMEEERLETEMKMKKYRRLLDKFHEIKWARENKRKF